MGLSWHFLHRIFQANSREMPGGPEWRERAVIIRGIRIQAVKAGMNFWNLDDFNPSFGSSRRWEETRVVSNLLFQFIDIRWSCKQGQVA